MNIIYKSVGLLLVMFFSVSVIAVGEQSSMSTWEAFLKDKYFKDIELVENKTVLELKTPYRAEDASNVSVSVTSKFFEKDDNNFIKTIYVFVDENPVPLVGTFHFNKDSGKADLAFRVRVDKYSNVRVIAELNNGEFYMDTNLVRAAGGCSVPAQDDLKAAMKRRGKMKFRSNSSDFSEDLAVGQFIVRHPNLTGMQLDQRTRILLPEHYIKNIKVSYNGKEILTAQTGISISADPSFRFFFKPEGGGMMSAEVVDSKGEVFSNEFEVKIF